jgi:hypothetical protein
MPLDDAFDSDDHSIFVACLSTEGLIAIPRFFLGSVTRLHRHEAHGECE